MNVPVRDNWRIPMPTPPKGAKWTEPPKVDHAAQLPLRSRRLHRRLLPSHFPHPRRRRHGAPDHERRLEPLRSSVLGATASGSPSRRCASPDAENSFRKSQIYAANVATGEIKQLTHRNGTSSGPSYSPDGKLIAFMSADSTDHSAWAETKLWMMNADGTNAHVVSGTLDRPISGVRVGRRQQRRVLQRRERRVEEPVLRDDRRASSIR